RPQEPAGPGPAAGPGHPPGRRRGAADGAAPGSPRVGHGGSPGAGDHHPVRRNRLRRGPSRGPGGRPAVAPAPRAGESRVSQRLRRSQRIAAMVKMLLDEPGALVPLGRFADALGAAKSTISEDLALVRDTFQQLGLGVVETVAGAAGGVRYHPRLSAERMRELLEGLSRTLSSADRLLPGGFVYMTDIVFSPRWSARIGEAFATVFAEAGAQAVVTVETKGIPLAMATARSLHLPPRQPRHRRYRRQHHLRVGVLPADQHHVAGPAGHVAGEPGPADRRLPEGRRDGPGNGGPHGRV